MRLFGPLYDWTLHWAKHPRAPWALGGISFMESFVFPIPIDVLLIPMVLAQTGQWLRYAALATIFSVLGGVFGYWLGYWAFDWASTWLLAGEGESVFREVRRNFRDWGVWIIFVAAFTPIPYKFFTITAGFMTLAFVPFVFASIIGRAARFYLVAGIIRWVGPRYEPVLRQYVEVLGWALVLLLVVAFLLREWL